MNSDELKQLEKAGQIEQVKKEPASTSSDSSPEAQGNDFDALAEYRPILNILRRPRRILTTAPTFKPMNAVEAEQLYDDGVNRRRYYYVNGTWRYVTLT